MNTVEPKPTAAQLSQAYRVRREIARMKLQEQRDQHRQEMALTLLKIGVVLIPSESLDDHEIVVSRAVYDAAKELS